MIFDINNPKSLELIFAYGAEITSSGTTGPPKTIHRTPENLKAVARVGIESQNLTKDSKILTVMKMTHAGGLLVQTIPGFALGCSNKIIPFNAYNFFDNFKDCTHTSLAPAHLTALIGTKEFRTIDLSNKWITVGSDPVSYDLIRPFVERGATVMINWGMSEIGPVVINHVFRNLADIDLFKKDKVTGTPMGTRTYCQFKIDNGFLHVKGDISHTTDWFNTHDKVAVAESGMFYYLGRI
jgi:acyl-CoA synthetase (AMP-forming)/AMP-acid ligase II